MNCKRLLGRRGFAPDAEVIGVSVGATMSSKVYDLLITALVGGLLWLFVSVII